MRHENSEVKTFPNKHKQLQARTKKIQNAIQMKTWIYVPLFFSYLAEELTGFPSPASDFSCFT